MKYFLYITLFILSACNSDSNKKDKTGPGSPFWSDIQNFKKQDAISFPPKNAILFIGSSSFTNWKDVQDYFPGLAIINRGFGGSTLLDQLRYEKDIIFPYQPKQIVIYCGENDLASSDSIQAGMVYERFKTLFNDIRDKIPNVPIAFISLKPSPSRRHLMEKMDKANIFVRAFLNMQKNTVFIDVYHKMLNEAGQPLPEIFLDDSLHMNAKGYTIWQEAIEPYLLK
ncbi:MAG: GDSL-type esterase/lipase family protein [Bacteroidota bacterium]